MYISERTCTYMSFHVQDMCIHEPNMAKQFRESLLADLVHTVYMLFLFDVSTKKLFESFHYHVLFLFVFVVVR